MTMYETSELHKRVARYESAVDELRAAHQDIRTVLTDQVLYERWQHIGAELGFTIAVQAAAAAGQQQELNAMNQQIPQMAEAWAG
ncbi:uncharacterized protein YukE [Actinoplanes tereljensis]|uniref:Uncharacterized protein n=1 Tax=Paractinoplanes tereljensis TaxID=571912 RepID=A0A919NHM6_9ACTN|nr:hypothetical protein [Actinoplanes tereljensis]GIF18343.1 hypothetical protein Ate02nite_10730 [Actinoplanes tereljensis]